MTLQSPDARPAIVTDDVHRADFFVITAARTTAFAFNRSTAIRVFNQDSPTEIIPNCTKRLLPSPTR